MHIHSILSSFAAAALFASPPLAGEIRGSSLPEVSRAEIVLQDPTVLHPAGQSHGMPEVSLAEIVLQDYTVQHQDAGQLQNLLEDLVGRNFLVKERGGQSVENIQRLGQSLILYDTKEQVARLLETLKRLDVPPQSAPAGLQLRTLEYVPRFISLDTSFDALRSFIQSFDPRRTGSSVPNVSTVKERGMLVLRDTETQVAEMLALLKRIDQPEKQVLITVYVIGPVDAAGGTPLPPELAQNLAKLLPQFRFGMNGIAMLQTSVGGERELSLSLDGGRSGSFQLAFRPVAFDAETSSLTVERCVLRQDVFQDISSGGDTPARRQFTGVKDVFSTNTVFRGGEYTVLGATGAEPVLVVVRVAPL